MFKVLKNEFIKMISGKKFYVLNLLIILAMVTDVVLMKTKGQELKINEYSIFAQSIFGQAMRPVLPILMVVVIAEIFTDEYTNGTMKFMLMTGISRTQIMLGKLSSIAAYALIFMTVTFLSSYVTINIVFGVVSIRDLIFDLWICGIILVPLISFSIVISFFATIINNSGILIAIGIIIHIAMIAVDQAVHNVMYFTFSGGMYGYYFIKDYSIHTVLLFTITACVYIAVFSILDLLVINKKDIIL